MEDYMLALGSDDDDFSEYGDVQFQFGQQAMLNNNDSGVRFNYSKQLFNY